jgi:glucose-1-phosphate thymidylyltransferase
LRYLVEELHGLILGTHRSLLEASNFVEVVQNRQGLYVACIEEIAYRMGFIDKTQLLKVAEPLFKTDYGQYLVKVSKSEQLFGGES